MVAITIKSRGREKYYYLEHTFRENNNFKKKILYLGKELPKNIEALKKNFLSEIYKEKWYKILDSIKDNYSKEIKLMPKSVKEKELTSFMVKFTYDTQRIEGSKLTLRETADLLEKGTTPKSKPLNDVKEAEAHKNVFYEMLSYKKDLSLSILLYWHKNLFKLTKSDIAGNIRKHQVAISGSKFISPSPVEVYLLLEDFLRWYNKNKNKLHPVELAALVHLKFVTIHPFADGNGRVSRLIMNFILNKFNYPMLDIPYKGRDSYYNVLERSQVKNIELIFLQWFIKRYIKENKKYL